MDSLDQHGRSPLLEGPIWKGLLSFALPIFLGNVFQQLYNVADTLIVGNFIGKEALAAVASSGNLIFMLVGFCNGVAMGAGVVIAKFFGAKDEKSLSTAMHTAIALALCFGAFLTVLGVSVTPTILRWMGTPETVLPNSIAYFRTYFFGIIAMVMYNITTGILHAMGDSRHPLYYLIFASIVNVVLDLLFVGVFKWGVWAAAFATVISQLLSAMLSLRLLANSYSHNRLILSKIGFDWPMLKQIVRFGLPSGVQNAVISFANVIVQSNINAFGADAMAGCGAYTKIEGFAFLPVTCFAMSLATFTGQNLGAKQYDRVKQGAKVGILCSTLMAELVGLMVFLFAPTFIAIFNRDPGVVEFGVRQCRIESFFYCLLAFSHCMAGIFRGSGKASVPMIVMFSCWCAIRVTYITLAVKLIPRIEVVFWAYPITWTLSSIVLAICYFKMDWLHNFDRLNEKQGAKPKESAA